MMGIGMPINHNKMERIITLLYCLLLCAWALARPAMTAKGTAPTTNYLAALSKTYLREPSSFDRPYPAAAAISSDMAGRSRT